jgi:hypothetical protein
MHSAHVTFQFAFRGELEWTLFALKLELFGVFNSAVPRNAANKFVTIWASISPHKFPIFFSFNLRRSNFAHFEFILY